MICQLASALGFIVVALASLTGVKIFVGGLS